MKRIKHFLLLTAVLVGMSVTVCAQSFSGVFLTGNGEGAVGGNIHLTLNGNQVYFQSTLFQYWTVGTSLEPVWQLQGLEASFVLGSGTPGTWELGEFLGPIPGINPIPPGEEPIDPGFGLPMYSDGMRYSGSFTAPDGLGDALHTGAGALQLQIHGTANIGGSQFQDPHFSAVMIPVPEPSALVLVLIGFGVLAFRRRF